MRSSFGPVIGFLAAGFASFLLHEASVLAFSSGRNHCRHPQTFSSFNPSPRSCAEGCYSMPRMAQVAMFASADSSAGENNNGIGDNKKDSTEEEPEEEYSAAKEWAAKQRQQLESQEKVKQQDKAPQQPEQEVQIVAQEQNNKTKKKYVIVGGGWGGWGAAKALCQSGVDAEVILIDALPDPTGVTPYLSPTGKPVEAGTRGFWKDYPNINALCDELGLDQNEVFTPFTNSSFYSPDGLEATAPVFSEAEIPVPDFLSSFLPDQSALSVPQLPSPLGQVLATFPLFERIPLSDRASMVGLLLATIDCLGGDESVQLQYDKMTAHDLFLRFKLSNRLVTDFITPTLLVGLFKPPEELSALVVMELLYYYALAHQDSFDVRWIKNGTVSDSLIAPLAQELLGNDRYGLKVLGGCRVGEISLGDSEDNGAGAKHAHKIQYSTFCDGALETKCIDNVDGVILALGAKGMESVVKSSPDLARFPVFSKAASLKGIDVISCRIWLDRKVKTRTPANVFSRFDSLRGAGGTFFMLDQFQEGAQEELWGGEKPQGSVLAADFYNAGALLSLSDEDLINVLMKDLLPSAVPRFADAKVVDSWVGKYAGTVSWFSPGSYSSRPPLEGAGVNLLPNVKCAGDWVRMGEREHGAKGLCQERAFVSGLEAANSLLRSTGGGDSTGSPSGPISYAEVLPVRDDEAQFKLGVQLNNQVMKFVPRFWTRK